MVCQKCAALPPEFRRHPAPNAVLVAADRRSLAELVCSRCGASRIQPDSSDLLLDTLLRLERVRFGAGTAPLLQTREPAPAASAA